MERAHSTSGSRWVTCLHLSLRAVLSCLLVSILMAHMGLGWHLSRTYLTHALADRHHPTLHTPAFPPYPLLPLPPLQSVDMITVAVPPALAACLAIATTISVARLRTKVGVTELR
jgi:hypothetical protein